MAALHEETCAQPSLLQSVGPPTHQGAVWSERPQAVVVQPLVFLPKKDISTKKKEPFLIALNRLVKTNPL